MSKLRSSLKEDRLVIDHISFILKEEDNQAYFDKLHSTIKIRGYAPKPHLTIAYSPIKIDYFPIKEIEGERIYPLRSKHVIGLNPYGEGSVYRLHTDHHKREHLVLDLSYREDIYSQYEFYRKRNAHWFIDQYRPLLIIEVDTSYQEEDLKELEVIDFLFKFDYIRYKRFIEREPFKQ